MTIIEDLVEVINALPLDEFITVDSDGQPRIIESTNWDRYIDNSDAFNKAMIIAAYVKERLELVEFDPDDPADVQVEKILEKGITL